MKEINKIVKLKTNDEDKQLILGFVSLYDLNYFLSVSIISKQVSSRSSAKFTGQSLGVEFLRSQIEKFVKDLQSLVLAREGTVQINDTESDDFFMFTVSPLGQLTVNGQVGGSHRDHCMKFMFQTDQTVLEPLIKDLNLILDYKDEL